MEITVDCYGVVQLFNNNYKAMWGLMAELLLAKSGTEDLESGE